LPAEFLDRCRHAFGFAWAFLRLGLRSNEGVMLEDAVRAIHAGWRTILRAVDASLAELIQRKIPARQCF